MKQRIKKAVKTGYGLGLMTVDEAKKMASEMKKELGLNESESRHLAKELMRSSKKAGREMINVAGKYLEKAVLRSGLVEKSDVAAVKSVIRKKIVPKLPRFWEKGGALHKLKKKVSRQRK